MDWGGFVDGGGIDFVHGYEGFVGAEGSRGRLSGSHCAGIAEVMPLEVLLERICLSVVQSIATCRASLQLASAGVKKRLQPQYRPWYYWALRLAR